MQRNVTDRKWATELKISKTKQWKKTGKIIKGKGKEKKIIKEK